MSNYDLGTAKGKIVVDASDAVKGFQDAEKAAGHYRDEQGRLRDEQGRFVKGTDQGTEAIKKQGMSLDQAGSTLQQSGVAMMGFGTAALAGFGYAVKSAADFEQVLSGVAAVSGATDGELDKLRKKALQLGADTKYSATEAGLAMEELVKAGLSVDEVLNGAADAAVYLAAAGEIDLANAASIASAAMNNFNLEAKELPRVADLIAGAANASAIDVSEFAMSLQQSGAAANLAGLTFDDLALGIAAMGNAGIKGSDAGTSLKTMLMNLQPATKKQNEMFMDLGIVTKDGANAFFTMEGKAKSLTEIAGILQNSTKDLTDQQKMMALETMFGSDAIRAAAVLANEGASGFEELASQMGAVTAQDVAEKRMDNLAGSLEKLGGAFETLMIQSGSPFQDVLRKIVDGFAKFIDMIAAMPAWMQTALASLLAAGGAFLLFAGGASFALGTTLKFFNTLKEFKAALSVVKSLGLVTKAVQGLNLAFLSSPIFWVIAAIAALGFALYKLYQNHEGFRNFVDGLWQSIQKIWDNILDFFKKIPEWFSAAFDKVKEVVGKGIDWIKKNWDLLLPILMGPFGIFIVIIKRWGGDILDFFKGLPGKIGGAIGGLWDKVVSIFKEFPGNVLGFIGDGIGKVVDLFTAIPGKIAGALGKVGGGIKNFFGNLFGGGGDEAAKGAEKELAVAQNRIIGGVNDLKAKLAKEGDFRNGQWFLGDVAVGYTTNGHEDGDIVIEGVREIRTALEQYGDYRNGTWYVGDVAVAYAASEDSEIVIKDLDAITQHVEMAGSAAEKNGDKTKGFFDKQREASNGMRESLKNLDFIGFFKNYYEGVKSLVTDSAKKAWELGKDFVTNIGTWFKELPGRIGEWFSNAQDKVQEFRDRIVEKAKEIGKNFVDTIVNFFKELPGKIGEGIGFVIGTIVRFGIDLVTAAWDIGSRFVGSLIEWFQQLPGRIWGFLTEAWNSVYEWSSNMISSAWDTGVRFFNNLVEWIQQLPGRIWELLTEAWNTVVDWGQNVISKAWEIGTNVFNNIVEWFQQLPGRILGFLTEIWNTISYLGAMIWNKATEIGRNVFNGVVSFVGSIPGRVAGFFGQIVSGIGSLASRAGSGAMQVGRNIFNGITNFISNIPSTIAGAFGRVVELVKGLVSRAFNAAKDFGAGLWNGFKKGMGINSPSFIEKAMFQMNDTVDDETNLLKKHIGTLQNIGNGLPNSSSFEAAYDVRGMVGDLGNVSALVEAGPASQADGSAASMQVMGPLLNVENLEVRNDEDITKLSRGLAEEMADKQRALGKKVVNVDAKR